MSTLIYQGHPQYCPLETREIDSKVSRSIILHAVDLKVIHEQSEYGPQIKLNKNCSLDAWKPRKL